jgi:hypothetical protein
MLAGAKIRARSRKRRRNTEFKIMQEDVGESSNSGN